MPLPRFRQRWTLSGGIHATLLPRARLTNKHQYALSHCDCCWRACAACRPVTVGLRVGMPSFWSPPLNLGEADYANTLPPTMRQQGEAQGTQAAVPVNSVPIFMELLPPPQQQQLVPPYGRALPATTQVQAPQAQIRAQVQQTHVRIQHPVFLACLTMTRTRPSLTPQP